jgi:transcriptional regulator with XRE-family HTH domain
VRTACGKRGVVSKVAFQLRAARARAGLSQEKLARKAGVHPVTISQWEMGRARMRAVSAGKVAKALGLPLEDLLKGQG